MGLFGKSKAEREAEERRKAFEEAERNKPYILYLDACPFCKRAEWNAGLLQCQECQRQFCGMCERKVNYPKSGCPAIGCGGIGKRIEQFDGEYRARVSYPTAKILAILRAHPSGFQMEIDSSAFVIISILQNEAT